MYWINAIEKHVGQCHSAETTTSFEEVNLLTKGSAWNHISKASKGSNGSHGFLHSDYPQYFEKCKMGILRRVKCQSSNTYRITK